MLGRPPIRTGIVCVPVGSELAFTEPVRWNCGAIIKRGYRLARTFVDETEDTPFRDKMTLDGQREIYLSGLMVGQMVRAKLLWYGLVSWS